MIRVESVWIWGSFRPIAAGGDRQKSAKSGHSGQYIAGDPQGLPHAVSVTTAEITDREGVLQALERCSSNLTHVRSLLCDSGYTGKPFAEGVRDILGDQVTVQIAKRSELHRVKVMPKRLVVEREPQAVEELRA